MNITRRDFGALLTAAAAAAQQNPPTEAAQTGAGQFQALVPETPAFDGKIEFTAGCVSFKAEPFPMRQVRLLPNSAYNDAHEWNRGYMERITADRLLYTFRENAGLPVGAAKPLGGWEQPENGQRSSELRGHFVGHFLSASAQLAANGDMYAKSKADYMVAELAKCQQKSGGKYLSAFPTTWWDRLEKGERVWAPFYTIHKIIGGCSTCTALPEIGRRSGSWREWPLGRMNGPPRKAMNTGSRSSRLSSAGSRRRFIASRRQRIATGGPELAIAFKKEFPQSRVVKELDLIESNHGSAAERTGAGKGPKGT
jgi:hypothetical protein